MFDINQAQPQQKLKTSIVMVDDDFVIREILKKAIVINNPDNKYSFYTSEDGLEGVGYLTITRPDIAIIDSTLPKYSGREMIDYLLTNQFLFNEINKIIILVETEANIALPNSNFILINKKNPSFLSLLMKAVEPEYSEKKTLTNWICARTLKWANRKDLLVHKLNTIEGKVRKLPFLPIWLFCEIITSLYLSTLRLFTNGVADENIKQNKKDLYRYRVKYYPTFIGIFVTFIFLLIEFILYIIGGITIFHGV